MAVRDLGNVIADVLTQCGVPRPVAVLIQEMYEALDSERVALESPRTAIRGTVSARSAFADMWRAAVAGVCCVTSPYSVKCGYDGEG